MKIIEYTISKDGLTFSDAIILDDDSNLSEADIEALKQLRFDNWYKVITTPSEQLPEELNNGE